MKGRKCGTVENTGGGRVEVYGGWQGSVEGEKERKKETITSARPKRMARRTARRKLREGDSLFVYNLIGREIIVLKQFSFRGIARLVSVSPRRRCEFPR